MTFLVERVAELRRHVARIQGFDHQVEAFIGMLRGHLSAERSPES